MRRNPGYDVGLDIRPQSFWRGEGVVAAARARGSRNIEESKIRVAKSKAELASFIGHPKPPFRIKAGTGE